MKTVNDRYDGNYEVPENKEDIKEMLLDMFGRIKQQASLNCDYVNLLIGLEPILSKYLD